MRIPSFCTSTFTHIANRQKNWKFLAWDEIKSRSWTVLYFPNSIPAPPLALLHLKITSISACTQTYPKPSRNQSITAAGVEDVAETLQELWISYNILGSLKGVEKLPKLRVREPLRPKLRFRRPCAAG